MSRRQGLPAGELFEFCKSFVAHNQQQNQYRHPRSVPNIVNNYGTICRHLREILGRDAKVSDLNAQTHSDYSQALKGSFLGAQRRNQLQNVFKRVWRYAAELGHVELAPESRPKSRSHRRFVQNLDKNGNPYRVSEEPGTLWHLAKTEYFPRNLRINNDTTIENYRMAFRDFTEFLGRSPTLDDLNDDSLCGLTRHLQRKKLAATTINGSIGRIGALWNWIAKRRLINSFPTFQKIPEPKRIPKAWTKNDLAKILNACRSRSGFIENGVRRSVWWTALHLVLWDSGARIGEIVVCRWDWLDLETGLLRVPAEARKGKVQDAEYQLHATTIEWVKALRPVHPDLVFGERKICSIYSMYKLIRRAAGVAADRGSAFHRMRRSVASHLHAAGHNATDVLQHSAESITRESYLDPAIIGAVRPAEVLFRPEGSQELPPPNALEVDESLGWL